MKRSKKIGRMKLTRGGVRFYPKRHRGIIIGKQGVQYWQKRTKGSFRVEKGKVIYTSKLPIKSVKKTRSPQYFVKRGFKMIDSWSQKAMKRTPKEAKRQIIILRDIKKTKKKDELTPAEFREKDDHG